MTSDDAARERSIQSQNEDLRSRNQALLAKNAQLEEQLWRLHSSGSPFAPDKRNVDGMTPPRPEPQPPAPAQEIFRPLTPTALRPEAEVRAAAF